MIIGRLKQVMDEPKRTLQEPPLLSVSCSDVGIKSRSYSDTSIFKILPQKYRHSQSSDDGDRISPPLILESAEAASNETSTAKPKRKFSRPRSPFTSEKTLDLFSRITKNDLIGKVTASSPKTLPRRAKSKGRETEVQTCLETVSD